MNSLVLISRIARKLHVQGLVRGVFLPWTAMGTRAKMTHEEAESYLTTLSPDMGSSTLCENQVSEHPRYDLQIVVPVYNVKDYLKECIQSILAQKTRYTYQIVMVDDGSTDGSGQLADEIASDVRCNMEDVRCIRVIHQENRGLAGARNKGLEAIDARYVMFVDSDDRLKEGAIEALLTKADATDADIVDGGFLSFEGQNTVRFVRQHADWDETDDLFGFAWGKVYRASLFRHVHFPERYWYEDTVCSMLLFKLAKKKATIRDIVYEYRKNAKSITHSLGVRPKILDLHWVTRQVLRDKAQLGVTPRQVDYEEFLQQVLFNMGHIYPLNRDGLAEALCVCSEQLRQTYYPGMKAQQTTHRLVEDALATGNVKKLIVLSLF